jgi:repressor LexA
MALTRRQQQIYKALQDYQERFEYPPTYNELCQFLGLRSKGSLHKHIQALIQTGLVEPTQGQQRGIRLVNAKNSGETPFLGYIAAGEPIEAITQTEWMKVPEKLLGSGNCYVIQVAGDSMREDGIFDGDYVVIERQLWANNGEIVVALIHHEEVTLKKIEQQPGKTILYPANSSMSARIYRPDEVQIQGVLRGLMRAYL